MIYLFSRAGLEELQRFAKKPFLLALDFDGTLAPITMVPDKARIPGPSLTALDLIKQKIPVALLSGRGRPNLIKLLSFRPDYAVGNHGLEGGVGNSALRKLAVETIKTWAPILLRELPDEVWLENKRYSLAAHYRTSRRKAWARQRILNAAATLKPRARLVDGKDVINIIPWKNPNKANALEYLMRKESMKHAIFLGDDHNDRDVFKMSRKRVFSVVVGKRPFGAAYFLKSQREVTRLLERLVDCLPHHG